MIKRIYTKLVYYIDEVVGVVYSWLEKTKLLKPIPYKELEAKQDVIQITHSYPINYNSSHEALFNEWKSYPTFENKIFQLNGVTVSYKGIVSKGLQCFVPALPHPVFKNSFGFRFNINQKLVTKKQYLSASENYFLVHDMWAYANYFHWIVDSLCRLEFWKDQLPQYTLLIHEGAPKYIIETLQLYPFKTMVVIPKNVRVVVPHLFVPNYCAWSGQQHPIVLKHVKENLLGHYAQSQSYKRVYVSRGKQARRKIANEQEVISLLKKHQFEIIYFEGMSVAEQIAVTSNAKLVVTSHGANVTNALFMKQGKVLELLRNDKPNFCYWSTLTSLEIPYYYQLCQLVNHDDLLVDLVELEKNIQLLV